MFLISRAGEAKRQAWVQLIPPPSPPPLPGQLKREFALWVTWLPEGGLGRDLRKQDSWTLLPGPQDNAPAQTPPCYINRETEAQTKTLLQISGEETNSRLGLSLPPSLLRESRTNLVLMNSVLSPREDGGTGAPISQGHKAGKHLEQSTLIMMLPLPCTGLY